MNKNLLWTRSAPLDVAAVPINNDDNKGIVYGLTKGLGLMVGRIGDEFAVNGDHNASYQDFAAGDVEGLASLGNKISLRYPDKGIGVRTLQPGADVLKTTVDPAENLVQANLARYDILKIAQDGKSWFAGTNNLVAGIPTIGGKIYRVDDVNKPLLYETGLHKRTLAFDVDSNGTAVVVFEDGNGGQRIRVATNLEKLNQKGEDHRRGGGLAPLTSLHQFKELSIFKEQDTTVGKSLLLDSLNNVVIVLDYGLQMSSPYNHTITDTESGLVANAIPTGKNPQGLTFNADKSKVYIANKDDDTITVLTLKKEGKILGVEEIRASTQKIVLKDYTKNNLAIHPTKVTYQQGAGSDHLLVASEGIKGMIVVSLEKHVSSNAVQEKVTQPPTTNTTQPTTEPSNDESITASPPSSSSGGSMPASNTEPTEPVDNPPAREAAVETTESNNNTETPPTDTTTTSDATVANTDNPPPRDVDTSKQLDF